MFWRTATIPLAVNHIIGAHVNPQAQEEKVLVNKAAVYKLQECKTLFHNTYKSFIGFLPSISHPSNVLLPAAMQYFPSVNQKGKQLEQTVPQTLTDKKHHIQHSVHPAQHISKETHSW